METASINGWPIEYTRSGGAGQPAMVMLTGWAQDHRLFKAVEPLLARDFQVFRVNFRGHDALLTDRADFTAEDMAADVVQLIRWLGLHDVRLVSTSHGCWVNVDVHELLGESSLGKTVVIDWLMRPFEAFDRQVSQGREPGTYAAARRSMFDEWTATTTCLDVIDHVNREMTWFGGEMWMRACREIQKSYRSWGTPLARMSALDGHLEALHLYSQPLSADYREFQEEFSRDHAWFTAKRIPGETHFPTLENPGAVAAAIREFFA